MNRLFSLKQTIPRKMKLQFGQEAGRVNENSLTVTIINTNTFISLPSFIPLLSSFISPALLLHLLASCGLLWSPTLCSANVDNRTRCDSSTIKSIWKSISGQWEGESVQWASVTYLTVKLSNAFCGTQNALYYTKWYVITQESLRPQLSRRCHKLFPPPR